MPWDLSRTYDKPESELIDYHGKMGVGFYMPNLGSFYDTVYPPDIKITVEKSADGREIRWRMSAPSGTLERARVWEEDSYSWAIPEWGVKDKEQLLVLAEVLSSRKYRSDWKRYHEWVNYIGDVGVVYLGMGYSGMGQLLNYWMGIEGAMYAICDWPETVRSAVDKINENNLELIDLACTSPAEVIVMGDNFSSDIQPPSFFEEWSREYYAEAIRRLHAAGKYVAVHIDGRLKGSLKMFSAIGADCADAVTPKPTGDLSPAECRMDAGEQMILSGGVPPCMWLPDVSDEAFGKAVVEWLELSKTNPRIIANAGDQVPPHALEKRIVLMKNIVDEYAF
jgi:hypothetical protein